MVQSRQDWNADDGARSLGGAGEGCPYRKSNPRVLVMQAAENRSAFDRPTD